MKTKRNQLPTQDRREQIFARRLKREEDHFGPSAFLRMIPLYGRQHIYKLLSGETGPTQEGLVHLSQILRQPMEYLYPPLPEDDPYQNFPQNIIRWLDSVNEALNSEEDNEYNENLRARLHVWRSQLELVLQRRLLQRRPWAIVPVLKQIPGTAREYPDPDGPFEEVLHLTVPEEIDRRNVYAIHLRFAPPSRLVQPNTYVVFFRGYKHLPGGDLWVVSRDGIVDIVPHTAVGNSIIHGPVLSTLTLHV